MSIPGEMREDLNSSEVVVLRTFVARLMSVQKQFYTPYHGDSYLRDRLIYAVDIKLIQETLGDRVPRTSHQIINRVLNRLSNKPKSARTAIENLVSEFTEDDELFEEFSIQIRTKVWWGRKKNCQHVRNW